MSDKVWQSLTKSDKVWKSLTKSDKVNLQSFQNEFPKFPKWNSLTVWGPQFATHWQLIDILKCTHTHTTPRQLGCQFDFKVKFIDSYFGRLSKNIFGEEEHPQARRRFSPLSTRNNHPPFDVFCFGRERTSNPRILRAFGAGRAQPPEFVYVFGEGRA